MKSTLLIFLMLLLSSCTRLSFSASGETPFKISANKQSERVVEMDGRLDFYFWGLSGNSLVDMEALANVRGLNLPSYVSVLQTTSPVSLFYTLITLGLYCPVDYKVVALTSVMDL